MQEIRFIEQFESLNGEVSVHLTGPLTTQTYDALSNAMERIKKQVVALIAPQHGFGSLPSAGGAAVDPSEFTAKIPGVDPTDRRRGPRAKKTARRK